MIKKLPVPPRSAGIAINLEPFPTNSQTPDALGESRFRKRQLRLWGSDVLAWGGCFHEVPLLQKLQIGWSSTSHIPEDIKTLRRLKTLAILNVPLYEFLVFKLVWASKATTSFSPIHLGQLISLVLVKFTWTTVKGFYERPNQSIFSFSTQPTAVPSRPEF